MASLSIQIPQSWDQYPLALRYKYVRILSSKGEVPAAMALLKGHLSWLEYHKLIRYGTTDDLNELIDEIDTIDGSLAIVPSMKLGRLQLRFPKQYLEHTPLMVFAKAEELYKSISNNIEADDTKSAIDNMIRLVIALTAPSGMTYQQYERYVSSGLTARQRKQISIYIPVAMRYFSANKQWIYDTYGALLFGNSDGGGGIDLGWHGTAMAVAESRVYGDIDKVYSTYLHMILLYLVKKKEEYNKIKNRQPK